MQASLQQIANIVCYIFCGLKLMGSCRRLADLGSGTLAIDVISAGCRFNGRPIDALPIAVELRENLEHLLKRHNIDPKSLVRARLTALIDVGSVDSSHRVTSEFHMRSGQIIQEGKFHQLKISCQSEIATGDALFRSKEDTVAEIPYG